MTSDELQRLSAASCFSLIPSASGRRAVIMCCALVLIGSRRMSDERWDVNQKSKQIAYP